MSASTIFDEIASNLSADPNKSTYISRARDQTSSFFYGTTNYELAVALLAAHNMTLDKASITGTGTGELAGKREGDLSVTYQKSGADSPGGSDFDLTNYGKRLKGLRAGSGSFMYVQGVEEVDLS